MGDNTTKRYFVTGGAGYIGSHTVLALLRNGHDVTIFDNFYNAERDVIVRLEALAGKAPHLIEGDIQDEVALMNALNDRPYEAVLHFAGLKSVAESVEKPALYHAVNVGGTQNLLAAMGKNNCSAIVFSSSATVYGNQGVSPIDENCTLDPVNPYGQSKADCEILLQDECRNDSKFSAAILRYFNPVGADKSAQIGELPKGRPANLMPLILEVANGEREKLAVFGDDYNTPDGTGVRDYIHVTDLAAGHIATLPHIAKNRGTHKINLGTGRGYSVIEMIKTFETINNVSIPYSIEARRPGDLGEVVANPNFAQELIGWKAQLGLEDMCLDAWIWKKSIAKNLS